VISIRNVENCKVDVINEADIFCNNVESCFFICPLLTDSCLSRSKLTRKQASILYCTTGIMLKWLVTDP
jgi:hypothetical protein